MSNRDRTRDSAALEDRSSRILRDGPELLWLQVADDIDADITSGDLPPRAQLPGELRMCRIYGVCSDTVWRALHHLRDRGLVIVVRGRGTFVAPNPGEDQQDHSQAED